MTWTQCLRESGRFMLITRPWEKAREEAVSRQESGQRAPQSGGQNRGRPSPTEAKTARTEASIEAVQRKRQAADSKLAKLGKPMEEATCMVATRSSSRLTASAVPGTERTPDTPLPPRMTTKLGHTPRAWTDGDYQFDRGR